MKKIKNVVALIVALNFLTLSCSLVACNDAPSRDNQTEQTNPLPEENDNLTGDNSTDTEIVQPPSDSNSSSGSNTGGSADTNGSTGGNKDDGTQNETPVKSNPQYIRCTGQSVNLRLGAGTNFSVAGQAQKGETYAVVGKVGQWYKTYYRNKTVYFSASYASVFSLERSDNEEMENVILEGYKLLGTPYVYGAVRLHDGKGNLLSGFSVHKFDCSSLIQYVFYKGANKVLQVNTRTQVKQGKFVSKSNLQRGDCIFFTNESRRHLSGVERIGHVALYLGNDYILHTASDYARIEKMSATRWKDYVEARRFL